jgi:hypothetical protein
MAFHAQQHVPVDLKRARPSLIRGLVGQDHVIAHDFLDAIPLRPACQ